MSTLATSNSTKRGLFFKTNWGCYRESNVITIIDYSVTEGYLPLIYLDVPRHASSWSYLMCIKKLANVSLFGKLDVTGHPSKCDEEH